MNKDTFIKKLLENKPTALSEYNYDSLPEQFNSHDYLTIHCNKHGTFKQKTYSHLYGQGCPICGREKSDRNRAIGSEEFINRSKAKYGDKFNYDKTSYLTALRDVIITCPEHGDFSIRPKAHMWLPHGCPKCSVDIPRFSRKEEMLKKAKETHGDKFDYSKTGDYRFNSKLEIICPKHGSFWIKLSEHINSKFGCPLCSRDNNKFSRDNFIEKSNEIHKGKYDYSKVVYETNQSRVKIICPKHGEFIQRASSHLAGCKCKKCFDEENRQSLEEFVKKSNEIHSNKYDYSRAVYLGNKKPLEVICPKHGSFWIKPNNHLYAGCQRCSESKGESEVVRCLTKYNIGFIREHKILPYRYRYDFFLPEFNIYIEFNGQQHYKPIEIFGGMEALLKVRENDKMKRILVKQNNGHLIVLTYLNLSEGSVEKALIFYLKKIYPYWFLIDGKLHVYKSAIRVCDLFGISKNIEIKDIVGVLEKTVRNFKVLF